MFISIKLYTCWQKIWLETHTFKSFKYTLESLRYYRIDYPQDFLVIFRKQPYMKAEYRISTSKEKCKHFQEFFTVFPRRRFFQDWIVIKNIYSTIW